MKKHPHKVYADLLTAYLRTKNYSSDFRKIAESIGVPADIVWRALRRMEIENKIVVDRTPKRGVKISLENS